MRLEGKINMHRKLFALALVCGVMLLAGSCNKGGSDKVKIGFIVKQPEIEWFKLEWRFADEAARQYGFELIKIPGQDGEKVISAIDNLATTGAKGFVICTPDTKLGKAIMDKANQNGLKVLAVDDQFVDANGQPMTEVPYLGISANKIGNAVGEALAAEMKKRNWPAEETGLCVVTRDELDTARARTDGAIESLKAAGFPESKIFKAPQKTTDQPGAMDAVSILLTQQQGIKRWLICGMNDDAVLGAVRAMEGRGFNAENVIGVGIGGTESIAEFERSAPTGFFASILLQPRQHGFKTAEMMYKWVHDGVEPPKDTRTAGILITRENFQQALKDEGIR
jgi:L-arabinose transport system substrate-binding protein